MKAILGAFRSRTVWLAIGQAVVGVVIVVLTEADMVGYATMVKSAADIMLRLDTDKPLSGKLGKQE
jgi:hypothetical protein